MRLMIVNQTTTNINIAVDNPYRPVLRNLLQRSGPLFSILLKRGTSYNILPHFKSLKDAHNTMTRTRHIRKLLVTGRVVMRAFDDFNNPIDIDKALSGESNG